MRSRAVALCVLALLFASPLRAGDAAEGSQRGCEARRFALRSDFPGGRVSRCIVRGAAHIEVWTSPEDAPPINDSAWYAFRLEPRAPGEATITLRTKNGTHRYVPKVHLLSRDVRDRRGAQDGRDAQDADANANWELSPVPGDWRALPTFEVLGKNAVRLRVALRDAPVLVAAQELVLPRDYTRWEKELARHPSFRRADIGTSKQGRALSHIELGSGDAGAVVLLGRQHPPEVPGALALFAFGERLVQGDALAENFLARFRVHLFPLLNPDGVVRGHWRNGTGGVDLNRDWGPFTQPETAQVRRVLAARFPPPARPLLMLDFHATRRDVLYTQLDSETTQPANFHRAWFACLAAHEADDAPALLALRDPRRTGTQANAKNYFHHHYGIPTATYEAGDETPRVAVRAHARAFAEAMMRTLLGVEGCGTGAPVSATPMPVVPRTP